MINHAKENYIWHLLLQTTVYYIYYRLLVTVLINDKDICINLDVNVMWEYFRRDEVIPFLNSQLFQLRYIKSFDKVEYKKGLKRYLGTASIFLVFLF